MPTSVDLLDRKRTHFVLWRPVATPNPPALIVGQLQPGNPPTLVNQRRHPLQTAPGVGGLWQIAATDCGLQDGQVYHYWFEVDDTNPNRQPAQRVWCTDPTAFCVDWRLLAPRLPPPFSEDNRQPASVLKFQNDQLVTADPGGETPVFADDPGPSDLPVNNQLVVYELPTAWSRSMGIGGRDVGTFRDVRALVDETVSGANFADLDILQPGRSYLTELGVNALELLPPADSFYKRTWGYDTAHFLAPDYELGFPDGNASPTANADLAALVQACHQRQVRFFVDAVMAFGREEAYQTIDFDDFYIDDPLHHQDDPDAMTSGRGGDGHQDLRYGFSSTLFRYTRPVSSSVYDPIAGVDAIVVPARQLMFTYLARWMRDFRVDGVRIDSVENVANWDFVGGFKDLGHALYQARWQAAGLPGGADQHFLVVGEELTEPLALLTQNRVDGLWNDRFRDLVRAAVLGEAGSGEPDFETTVRDAIDCRRLGFQSGTQAVNYITSHDVEGRRRERLFDMLTSAGLHDTDLQKRVQLAFVCLLTAVGIPMILAGEEFADQHDLFDRFGNVSEAGGKQMDAVDFTRVGEPLRNAIFQYVSRLVHFRTQSPALASDDCAILHVDFDGKRVLAWRRGQSDLDPVVVVANFSDFTTSNALTDPRAEYVVPNWPSTPPGRQWREVSQSRVVNNAQVGREPIFAWEAKVYTLA